MGNPVGWFEIYVDDMARAKAFYEQVFGYTFTRFEEFDIEMLGFPSDQDGYGISGSLIKEASMPAGQNSSVVYFMCDDCAVEEAKVEPAGGKIHRKKMSIGNHGFCSTVYDTEGNLIGLHSMK
ncbi:MAG: VOC family protein [Aestuariibacter sp.]